MADENNQSPMFEEDNVNQAKTWVQENLRVIVSVFIVAAIALGIYSYSQRTETLTDADSLLETQGEVSEEGGEESPVMNEEGATEEGTVQSDVKSQAPVSQELSQETETSFIEKAERGNGSTHLARRALAHYLEKNPDSALTGEHKVYIEDYLRKNVNFQGPVTESTSIEFSKDLISQAIEKSKTLNDRQLENLKKYSARVSAYR